MRETALRDNPIDNMILAELRGGERRVLSLTVAIRGLMDRADGAKGDLSAKVRAALRKLVVAGVIVDADGMYSLAPAANVQSQ